MNNLKTAILLIGLTALLVWIGSAIGGANGAVMAFVFAVVMNVGAYWFSDKLVLRAYGAQPVTEAEAPVLYGLVADLAQRSQIPMPAVYVIRDPGLNAFATGRGPSHAAVAVTEGLLRSLDRNELAGVLAHELSHVKHRDILIGTVAATLVGAVTMIGNWLQWTMMFGGLRSDDSEDGGNPLALLAVAIFAGLAATLIQLAISRSREYEADAGAARMLGDPQPLISALRKLEMGAQHLPMQASAASAHLFIVNPLRGERIARWFSTHPDTQDRIRALEALAGGMYSRA
jgi:heat shock protein HtpX